MSVIAPLPAPVAPHGWDIFCHVIDNLGDVGVCWRLATQLADRLKGQRRGAAGSARTAVRLWIDDASALAWMAPAGHPGVSVRPWHEAHTQETWGEGVLEAFGCELPGTVLQALAASSHSSGSPDRPAGGARTCINLEYLSAEPYVARSHQLPSPVLSGPGRGLVKHFFYPGFTPGTGGLLREPDLLQRQAKFCAQDWLQSQHIPCLAEEIRVSLFCYEPPALAAWMQACAQGVQAVRLLVTPGRAQAAFQAACQALAWPLADSGQQGSLRWQGLPWLSQDDYDHLLWACDLNFVRGEDSLVRAIWADRPFVWQLYPQEDHAHRQKLLAFMDMAGMDTGWRHWHLAWNHAEFALASPEPAWDLASWQAQARRLRQQLLAQDDLVSQLLGFAANQR